YRTSARVARRAVLLESAPLALNVMTLGVPCIYYGTEQSFDGHGSGDGADKFIREAMFGGEFGSFTSRERHFFDEDSKVYRELQKILKFREGDRIYTRGRQFLRPISGDGLNFGLPVMLDGQILSIVPWSRLLDDRRSCWPSIPTWTIRAQPGCRW